MVIIKDGFWAGSEVCLTDVVHHDDEWSSGGPWGTPLSISPVH